MPFEQNNESIGYIQWHHVVLSKALMVFALIVTRFQLIWFENQNKPIDQQSLLKKWIKKINKEKKRRTK